MGLKNKATGAFLVLVQVGVASAADYYVATNGVDANPGTLAAPFGTIQHAFDVSAAGDTIFLRGGTYRETVDLNSKSGASGSPITLTACSNEVPVISGLDAYALSWTSYAPGVYVANYGGAPFDQLFFNGKPMLEARWPNVPTDANGDWDFFSPDAWAAVDASGSSYGTIKDSDLAATGWNVSGSRVVLNVDHQFYCWSRVVSNHSAGGDTFNYPTDLASVSADPVDHFYDDRYYLVGEQDFLDAPGEWVLDAANNQLYFYPPSGMDPSAAPVEIKTRDYGILADQYSKHIAIDGITFWGTAFMFGEGPAQRSSDIIFRNNTVLYSSWTEYFKMPSGDPNRDRDRVNPTIQADQSQIVNNTFAYGALSGLFINGFDNLVENNVFHDFNYSSSLVSPSLVVGRNWSSYFGKGGRATVRYNTLYNGGGVLIQTGLEDNEIYQNHLFDMFRSCWGGNKDQAALYTGGASYNHGTRYHHNWAHNGYAGTPPHLWGGGMAIRGDDNVAGLTVDHNVVWNLGSAGIVVKSPDYPVAADANRVCNNTAFQHSAYNSESRAMIVLQDAYERNRYSSVINNMTETIYGGWHLPTVGTLAEFSNNSTGVVTDALLENADWFDFRPSASSTGIIDGGIVVSGITDGFSGAAPDVGACEAGGSIYWIPGCRSAKATFPIVPDGAVVSASRDVLMWRPGYNAVSHRLYFGPSPESLAYQAEFAGEANVYALPALSPGAAYYWRVDAVASNGSVVAGDVWSFTVEGFSSSYPTLLQHWEFNQPDGTQLTAATNSAGSASWSADKDNIAVSSNALKAVKSSGGTFVNSTSVGGATNGQYELSWTFADVDLTSPDGTYVTYGVGLYNSEPGLYFDIAFTRIVWSSGNLTIQAENGTSGTWVTLHSFGAVTRTTNVAVRMVCDLDTGIYDVYMDNNGAGEIQIGDGVQMIDGAMNTIRFGGSTQNLSADNFVAIDDVKLSHILQVDTPSLKYLVWTEGYDVGSQTNLLDDPDGDLLDNLAEYAWGGEPDNPDSQGNAPREESVSVDGTNYLQYIYYERSDAVDRGLATVLEVGTDLVETNWGVHTPEAVGSGSSSVAGYNAVTNRIPTDAEDRQFILHQLWFTP